VGRGKTRLHATTVRILAKGEGGAEAPALEADDDTLVDLDALLLAFLNLDVHLDGVAGGDAGQVVAEQTGFELVDDIHSVLWGQRSFAA